MSEIRLRVLILNGFLLPGSGHIYAKHHLLGATIVTTCLVSLIYMMVRLAVMAVAFFQTPEDMMNIFQFFASLWADSAFKSAFFLSIGSSLFSIADSFRITKGK